ncbi:MAG: 7TM diverse intracellular signaling domain-containing protein [Pelobium sp.]
MIKLFVNFLFILFSTAGFAQKVNQLADQNEEVKFSVLKDHKFSIHDVVNSPGLHFKETDSLIGATAYWLKVIAHNPSDDVKNYTLTVKPNLATTFYYFDSSSEKWMANSSILQNIQKPWLLGVHYFKIKNQTIDTFYIWVNVNTPNIVNDKFKASIIISSKEKLDAVDDNIKFALWIGLTVLGLFFLNNLYIYLFFKDRSVFYYLIIQLGGMVYLTSYWYFFRIPNPVLSYILENEVITYNINNLLTHISIVIIFYAFMQLVRNYLNTPKYLPVEDKLIKYLVGTYIILSFINIIINVSGFCMDFYTIVYDNVYCGVIIFFILFICIRAAFKKVPLSLPFLLANLLPLLFMLCIPIFHVVVSTQSQYDQFLPVSVVIAQALGFSIALITRTRSIMKDLNAKEIERRDLEFGLKEIGYLKKLREHELDEVNVAIILEKERNELLQGRLELNQRELASSALNMVQKGELLAFLKEQLQKLNWMDRYHTRKNLLEINKVIESNVQLDNDWNNFRIHFEHVHPDFFKELKQSHSNLTPREIRLHTYFHMKLSHKEIATLLDIDPASVRRAKTRLYKKMATPISED